MWVIHVPLLVVSHSCNDLTLFVSRNDIKLKLWVTFHGPSVSEEARREGGGDICGSGSRDS